MKKKKKENIRKGFLSSTASGSAKKMVNSRSYSKYLFSPPLSQLTFSLDSQPEIRLLKMKRDLKINLDTSIEP